MYFILAILLTATTMIQTSHAHEKGVSRLELENLYDFCLDKSSLRRKFRCLKHGLEDLIDAAEETDLMMCVGSNIFGKYAAGGGCNVFGCYYPGGGCNSFGCYYEGGGCNPFGCYHKGGSCNPTGCIKQASSTAHKKVCVD